MSILVVDAGTSSVRITMTDAAGTALHSAVRSTPPETPAPGRVEFDAAALRDAVLSGIAEVQTAAQAAGLPGIRAVGVTAQRASTVLWDRATGRPLGPGLGWQDVRTETDSSPRVAEGVRLHPNQSVAKIRWLLDEHAPSSNDVCAGTVDSWLIHALSGGEAHVTDRTHAMAAGLLTADASDHDDEVLEAAGVPRSILPLLVDTIGPAATAHVVAGSPPITAVVGDQQASLFGQGCRSPGDVKATFGTAGSFDACLDSVRPSPHNGTFPIVAWSREGALTWGLEGIMLGAGSCLDWLCDLGLLDRPGDADSVADHCSDTGDVWFVPALHGMGTPTWDLAARGAFVGITRGTGRAEIVRSVLNGVAHMAADVMEAIVADLGVAGHRTRAGDPLRIDGGLSRSRVFVQALADATRRPIDVSAHAEATTTGAALMAARGAGLHTDVRPGADVSGHWHRVEPRGDAGRDRWREAMGRAT